MTTVLISLVVKSQENSDGSLLRAQSLVLQRSVVLPDVLNVMKVIDIWADQVEAKQVLIFFERVLSNENVYILLNIQIDRREEVVVKPPAHRCIEIIKVDLCVDKSC